MCVVSIDKAATGGAVTLGSLRCCPQAQPAASRTHKAAQILDADIAGRSAPGRVGVFRMAGTMAALMLTTRGAECDGRTGMSIG